jgi:hypothetical protein
MNIAMTAAMNIAMTAAMNIARQMQRTSQVIVAKELERT